MCVSVRTDPPPPAGEQAGPTCTRENQKYNLWCVYVKSYYFIIYSLVSYHFITRPQLTASDSQLEHGCPSTHPNAEGRSLQCGLLRRPGARSFGILLDSRDASAWQAFLYFEARGSGERGRYRGSENLKLKPGAEGG